MKKYCLLICLTLIMAGEFCPQTSTESTKHRNCSFVGRPIIDILGSGMINGKALKFATPHLSGKAKKLLRNKVISVKIEVNETGKVVSAKADTEISLLRDPLEKAALETRFSPTVADGLAVKVKGIIVYERKNGKTYISDKLDPVEYTPATPSYDGFKLLRTFDDKILSVINNFKSRKAINAFDFVKKDQAHIQICLGTKTVDIVERIKQTGFELLKETEGDGLVGRIAISNLEKLTDIKEIRFIVPEIP